jgi:hypothetical protein
VRLNQPWLAPAITTASPPSLPGAPGRPLFTNWLVQAYPNPTAEIPTLAISTSQEGPATLLLLTTQGQPQQLVLSVGTTTLPLAAAQGLASGLYLLRVQQGSQQQTVRLLRP